MTARKHRCSPYGPECELGLRVERLEEIVANAIKVLGYVINTESKNTDSMLRILKDQMEKWDE